VDYRAYQVFKLGPWSQGPVLLQTLNLLEGFDLRDMGHLSTEYIHTVTEAMKLAYADRDQFYADPDFAKVPMRGLLSKEYAAERRKAIDRKSASKEHRPGNPWAYEPGAPPAGGNGWQPHGVAREAVEYGDTTSIAIADSRGNLFSSTPSSGWLLGGAFIAGDTGIPMSNRMQAFSLDAGSPNLLQGGKRPRNTLTPTLVLKGGQPYLAIGTPGGDNQDQQILSVLLNLFDFGMGLQQAIEAPRFNSLHMFSSFGKHQNQPAVLEIEDRVAPGVLEALREKGHLIQIRPAFGISTGIVAALFDAANGTVRAAADVRRERYAFGW
jgi:gamma-glutamyltranspeptidase / glutathione hydrolase